MGTSIAFRKLLLHCALLIASVGLISGIANAQTHVKAFDLPAQEATVGIAAFARQADIQLLISETDARDRRTNELRGSYSVPEALNRLLAGTGLTAEVTGPQTYTIVDQSRSPRESDRAALGTSDSSGIRFAQADSTSQDGQEKTTAQSNTELRTEELQEIVVTAQKRTERLQDVPISITVLDGDYLDRSSVEGIAEALNRVPGVATTGIMNGGGTMIAMRGVAAAGTGYFGASPIAYYLDSVPFGFVKTAFAPDANAYDLQRIEVLRGPQGTLYGASAQNGVVRILTQDANLNTFEFKARASTSGTDGSDDYSYRGDMAVNAPIVAGKLAARAVLGYQDLSGWIDHPNDKDVNVAQIVNMRLKINAQPTDRLSVGLSAWRSRSDYGAPAWSDANGQQSAVLPEPIAADYDALGFKLGYEFARFSVTSMTSHIDYKNNTHVDFNTFVGSPSPPLPSGLFTTWTSDVFSQEVILNSMQSSGSAWRWTAGGIYRDVEENIVQRFLFFPAPLDFIDLSKSFAVFGELTRLFLDGRLELTAGLRYFEDDVGVRENVRHTGIASEPLIRDDSTFDATTPRFVLTWHPRDRVTLYASYAEGFRSGFLQQPPVLNGAPGIPPAKPDLLKNYEVGAKGIFWGGRISLDSAVYFIDWQDVQQSLVIPFSGILSTAVVNSESASGMGYDFAATIAATERLQLGVNFSANDLTMDADVVSGSIALYEKGERLNFSPKYTAGASADYTFPMGGRGLKGRFSASANYTAEQDQRTLIGTTARYIATGDSMLIGRASFSVDGLDRWTATVFADNVTNERDSPIRQPWAGAPFPDWDMRARPRTVGLQFEFRY